MADHTTERRVDAMELSRSVSRALVSDAQQPVVAQTKEPAMPDRLTRLIDLAAELHGFNRTEIVVSLGILVARIERCTGKPPSVTLEEVPEAQVLNGAREGRDGAGILAVPLRLRASRQLERDQRAIVEARAALVAAEARAKKTADLVEQLAALAAPVSGGSHV